MQSVSHLSWYVRLVDHREFEGSFAEGHCAHLRIADRGRRGEKLIRMV